MKKYHIQNRIHFAGALIAVLFSNFFAVVLQFFKGDVLDYAVAGDVTHTILSAVLLLGFILGEVLFYFLYRLLGAKYAVLCTRSLKHDIFESILRLDYTAYRQRPQGEYVSIYGNDADSIRARKFEMLPLFWEILFKIVLVSLALFLLDWRIALITLFLLTTPLYIPKLIEGRLQKAQTEYLDALKQNHSLLNDWLSGFEIIQNFSIEETILTKFDCANSTSMKKLLGDQQLGAAAQLITTLISYLSYFIVLTFAAALVLKGKFSAGDFFVAIGMIDQLSYPLISLAEIIRQMLAVRPVCDAMERFLQTEEKRWEQADFREEIQFRDVTFGYQAHTPILQNFQFCLKRGERCLFKGPSGCGKTTAINLLLGYFPAGKGSVTIDGVPIEKAGSPYSCMTVVRQEAVLFRDTLRSNLTMYRDIPDDKLVETLRAVGLDRFADKKVLDSQIDEKGANLSGGEKKRICLARAILRDTPILILDEPLANLDDETAGRIEDLLLSVRNRTLLVVSHQFHEEKLGYFDKILDFSNFIHEI